MQTHTNTHTRASARALRRVTSRQQTGEWANWKENKQWLHPIDSVKLSTVKQYFACAKNFNWFNFTTKNEFMFLFVCFKMQAGVKADVAHVVDLIIIHFRTAAMKYFWWLGREGVEPDCLASTFAFLCVVQKHVWMFQAGRFLDLNKKASCVVTLHKRKCCCFP